MAADVKIDIAAEFTGKKAFKQADTATQKLTSNVKKLAGAVGLAYGTSAIIAYGKASVKAFAADEAAATRLSRAVENLGIGFANPAIADYIAKLEKSASIADDILRPAFQGLLTTTGSLTQSQKLLNDAITISRASGIDLATVTQDLGKGYVGVTRGLIKYNTGLTRAELTTMSFNEILSVILKKSAGAAEDYLDTTAYKFDVLSIATNNASEIIGGGLVDAFALVGGGKDASDAAYVIESIATALAKVTVQSGRTIGVIPTLIQNLKNLPRQIFEGFAGKQFGMNITIPDKQEAAKLTLTEKKQQELLAKMEKEALRREKERLGLLNKQNTAKKLQGVIDKANLALGKGTDVFDLDKIQIAAALTNQAEQLGKATNAAQVLQIANDTARLNVKRSILALEDAIASKDEAAIVAATNKLNADLKVLGALGAQNLKLLDIKSILDTLKPKDLINLSNLEQALLLLGKINLASTGSKTIPTSASLGSGIPTGDYIAPISTVGASIEAILEYADAAAARANAFADLLDMENASAASQMASTIDLESIARSSLLQGLSGGAGVAGAVSGSRYAAQAANSYNITIQAGIGDPEAIARAVEDVVRQSYQRGTSATGLLAV
jgi:nucleotide-binding universal stress UspA family protein